MTSSQNNPWFAVSMGLIGLIVGYSLATTINVPAGSGGKAPSQVANAPTPSPSPTPSPPTAPPTADNVPAVDPDMDHIRGNKDATISVIEYSDFECPFCKRHHPTMQALVDDYGDDVNWVYRHYPLGFHPNALPGALASECVAELGGNDAFWSFTDKVFETQGEYAYEDYVTELGLDVPSFKDCLESEKYASKVQDQMDGGAQAGVSGTPGNIVLNNKTKETRLVSGAQSVASFKSAVDALLGS
jgi:protein-disulfide isomerase